MEQKLSVKKESPRFFYGYIVVAAAFIVWIMSRVTNVWQMYIVLGVLMMGIGMSATDTLTMAAVVKWFVKRRGLMAGLDQTGSGVGGVVWR